MRTFAGMEVTISMDAELTIPAVLDRAEEQMTMTNLAKNTRKAYRLEIRRFFDYVGKRVCKAGPRTFGAGCLDVSRAACRRARAT